MKKKLLIMTLISALVLSFTACGSEELGQLKDTLSNLSELESNQKELKDALEALESLESVLEDMEAAKNDSSEDSTPVELGTFTFDIPEGFVEKSEGYYEHENGLDLSTINYLTQANDGSFYQVNGAIMVQSVEAQLEATYGIDLTISLTEEEFYEINGVDAFKYTIEYDLMEFHFKQTQVIVDAPETFHFVTCTLIDEENYADVFAAVIDSIRFE